MSKPLNIIIVEKSGILKVLSIKDYKEEELYKKCGFKKKEDFIKQNEWIVKYDNKKYFIEVYAKKNGRANSENKYDFPPPIDSTLFFGNCAILAFIKKEDNTNLYVDLSLELWKKIYEKLFGGFEDLSTTAIEDENEEDELDKIPKEKKTKQGYLKDGFVVDSSDGDEDISDSNDDDDDDDDDNDNSSEEILEDNDDCDVIIDLGSELSEDSYDDESDEDDNEK
jgi:hypothetical protein